MTRGGTGGRERVKTARRRSTSSNRWLSRQINDPYVKKAKAEGKDRRQQALREHSVLEHAAGLVSLVARL